MNHVTFPTSRSCFEFLVEMFGRSWGCSLSRTNLLSHTLTICPSQDPTSPVEIPSCPPTTHQPSVFSTVTRFRLALLYSTLPVGITSSILWVGATLPTSLTAARCRWKSPTPSNILSGNNPSKFSKVEGDPVQKRPHCQAMPNTCLPSEPQLLKIKDLYVAALPVTRAT